MNQWSPWKYPSAFDIEEQDNIIEAMAKAAYDYYLHLQRKASVNPISYAWIRSIMIAPGNTTDGPTWHVRGGITYPLLNDVELTFAHWDEDKQEWVDTSEQTHDKEAVGDDPLL